MAEWVDVDYQFLTAEAVAVAAERIKAIPKLSPEERLAETMRRITYADEGHPERLRINKPQRFTE